MLRHAGRSRGRRPHPCACGDPSTSLPSTQWATTGASTPSSRAVSPSRRLLNFPPRLHAQRCGARSDDPTIQSRDAWRRSRSTARRSRTRSSARAGPWIVTPGGRFTKEAPGVRELAEAAGRARAARRDLGPPEHRRVRHLLRRGVGVGDAGRLGSPACSARSTSRPRSSSADPAARACRCSRPPAIRDVVSKLGVWWISGGPFGLLTLAIVYCGESIRAAWQDGMEGGRRAPGMGGGARTQSRATANASSHSIRASSSRRSNGGCSCTAPTRTRRCRACPTPRSPDFDDPDARLPQRRERPVPHARDVGAAAPADPRLAARRAAVG